MRHAACESSGGDGGNRTHVRNRHPTATLQGYTQHQRLAEPNPRIRLRPCRLLSGTSAAGRGDYAAKSIEATLLDTYMTNAVTALHATFSLPVETFRPHIQLSISEAIDALLDDFFYFGR